MGNLNCDIIEKKKCSNNVDISEILQLVNNNSFLDNYLKKNYYSLIVVVEGRKRLWKNFKELKEHNFFNKFMICEL